MTALNRYPHKRAFFEMVRFDFVVGSNLQIYLMEANMSPNLSSKHFALNRRLYEQVRSLTNCFHLFIHKHDLTSGRVLVVTAQRRRQGRSVLLVTAARVGGRDRDAGDDTSLFCSFVGIESWHFQLHRYS